MWSWKHIKRHRQQVKQYKELYKTKITNKKPTDTLLKKLEVKSGNLEKSFISVVMKSLLVFNSSGVEFVGRAGGVMCTHDLQHVSQLGKGSCCKQWNKTEKGLFRFQVRYKIKSVQYYTISNCAQFMFRV